MHEQPWTSEDDAECTALIAAVREQLRGSGSPYQAMQGLWRSLTPDERLAFLRWARTE